MITNIIFRHSDSPITSDKPHYPYELPEGWVWTTLGEISNYGTTINIQVDDIDKNEWILELEDIEKETANIIQRLSASERSVKGTRHKFSAGSILYSKLRTYLNKVLVAPSEGYCTTEIMPFDTYGIISNEYICHVLRSPFFLDYTLQCGYGVKMPRLSTTDACNGMIPLPPLNEQIRIVEAIKYWFVLIDIIESGKENLQETIKQAKSKILDLAIHGKLVPQDPTDEPAGKLLKRINPKAEITSDNGHYQKLPNGWSITELCNISTILNGYAFKSSEYVSSNGIRIIRIANVQDGYIEDKLPQYYPKSKSSDIGHFLLEYNDLLMSLTGNVGRVGILPNSLLPAALNQRVACIRENRSIVNKYYLFYLFQSNKFCSECIKSAKGVAQLNISTEWLKSYTILLPPLAEQKRIVAKIEEIFAQLDAIETAL